MSGTTSPDNIVYPVSTDSFGPLETVLSTMATSIQNALNAIKPKTAASAAARDALFPTPVAGNIVFRTDTSYEQRYTGTQWRYSAGLIPVIPTSVSGTGVTVGPNGLVSFASSSAVYVNNCFTTEFDNYRVMVDVPVFTASAVALLRFRNGGVDDSSSNYNFQTLSAGVSTVSASQGVGFNFFQVTNAGGLACSITMDIFAPAKPVVTRGSFQYCTQITGTNTQVGSIGGAMNVATAYDGLTLFQSASAVMTGTMRLYGYNNL